MVRTGFMTLVVVLVLAASARRRRRRDTTGKLGKCSSTKPITLLK